MLHNKDISQISIKCVVILLKVVNVSWWLLDLPLLVPRVHMDFDLYIKVLYH